MDKTKIKHDKNDTTHVRIEPAPEDCVSVHRLPQRGESTFHKQFGLWICRSGCGGRSNSTAELSIQRYFQFYCISQLVEGTGYYRTPDGSVAVFHPGEGVLVTPGQRHMYGGYHESYTENTICFTGRLPDLLSGLGILTSGVIAMETPKRLLGIIRKAMDPALISQTQAHIDLLSYLYDLHKMNHQRTVTGDLLDDLTCHIQEDQSHWWTVKEMAEFCSMSEVRFRTIFRERFGMSPKRYIDRFKVNSAIQLMSNRNLTVQEIASSLGYIDPFHFSRRFKQLTGHSPRDYRQRVLIK